MNLVIIGGGAAGSQAALEAKKIDRKVNVTVIEKQKVPQYSLCGLPYALSGEIPSFDDLIIFPFSFIVFINEYVFEEETTRYR